MDFFMTVAGQNAVHEAISALKRIAAALEDKHPSHICQTCIYKKTPEICTICSCVTHNGKDSVQYKKN